MAAPTADSTREFSALDKGLRLALLLMIVGLTALRLAFCSVTELLPEEAYYWTYWQHPALGYFDHPPMVAWFVAMGTALFGNTVVGVRFATIISWIASTGLLLLIGRMWFGKRVAVAAALLFTLLPVYVGMGVIVTPDGPLLFFWLATLYFISQALHSGRGGYWLLAGVTFGGALLSKYYAILLAPSLLLFLVMSPKHRHWLRRPEPWLSLPIALLVFSPVIIWNMQHHWASFLFQSTRTDDARSNMLRDVPGFWGVQFALTTPLVFVLFICTAMRGVRLGWLQKDDRWNFAVSFALPLFLLFAAASFKTQIHVNWTAPAFLSLLPAAAVIALDGFDSANAGRAKRWRVGMWTTFAMCAAAIIFGHTSLAWGFPKFAAYTRAGGWRTVAMAVQEKRTRSIINYEPFVLGMDKYNIAAEMGFYLQAPNECVNTYAVGAPGLGYRFWTDLRKFEGRPAVAVLPNLNGNSLKLLAARFDQVDNPEHVTAPMPGGLTREVYLVTCRGYRSEMPLASDTKIQSP